MTKCIAAGCNHEAMGALCAACSEKLQKVEEGILKNAQYKINIELRQFERLMYIEPPLSVEDIAFRMVWTEKDVRWLLKKFKDDRN